LIEGILNASLTESVAGHTTTMAYEGVKTASLPRKEVERMYEKRKPTCPSPVFSIQILPRVFIPRTRYTQLT
jgi:hypothetical protein